MFPRVVLSLFLLLAFADSLSAQTVPPPSPKQVDVNEVYRRGDAVTVMGEGPRSAATEAWAAAMAPPEDDSHKWFVTLWSVKNCLYCEKLKADFQNAPELVAFITAPEHAKAWAHCNIYDGNDATQHHRKVKYRVTSYPTIVIQPPLDGTWGDPATVVFWEAGYDGNPKKLAERIRKAVRYYAGVMSGKGYPRPPQTIPIEELEAEEPALPATAAAPAPVQAAPKPAPKEKSASLFGPAGGTNPIQVNQAVFPSLLGQTAPFAVPSRPDPFNPQPVNVQPQVQWPPLDPNQQPQQPVAPAPDPFVQLQALLALLNQPGTGNLAILGFLAFQLIQWWKAKNNPTTPTLTPQESSRIDRAVRTTIQAIKAAKANPAPLVESSV